MWARSLGHHAYFGGMFALDEISDGVQYAVFDDICGGISFFPSYKSWLGQQNQFYATDKYAKKKLIKWSKPVIWVSNDDPRHDPKCDIGWMEANCIFVEVRSELYSCQ